MLVPGISFVTVRTWFVGWRTPDYGAGSRILEALHVSAIFVIVYSGLTLALLGVFSDATNLGTLGQFEKWMTSGWRQTTSWWTGLLALILLVGVPAGVAALFSWSRLVVEVDDDGNALVKRRPVNRNQSTPRAWDYMAYGAETPRFVRIKTAENVYIGGWYDAGGYTSTFPYERDIFITRQWRMSPSGEFTEPIEGSLGVWVPISDGYHVEWIARPAETE